MTMKIEQETRKFRGKDVFVTFNEYKYNLGMSEFDVNVQLSIDGCVFVGYGSEATKEAAYEEAIKNLEKELYIILHGDKVEAAKNNFFLAQKDLEYRKQEQNTARWFLEFTKDRVEQ